MVTFQDAIALARRTYVAIAMLPDDHRKRLEAELNDAHIGQGNGGEFDDWLAAMAANNEGTLQNAAIELLALYDLDEVKDEAERFLTNAGERVPDNQEQS